MTEDYVLGTTVYLQFTTRRFTTGVPFTLAGTPVISVLEENNATPITAGITLSVDRATVTGLNEVAIVASSGNGYESGKSYAAYISTGTVDSVSVVGEVIGRFTIEKQTAYNCYTRLGAPAGASHAADIAAIKADTAATLTDTAEIGTAGAGLTALGDTRLANLDAAITSRLASAGYTAPDNTTIALIYALVDTEIAAILAAVDTEIAAIKAKTDNLPNNPAAVGSEMVLSATGLDAVPYTATGAVALGRAFWSDTLTTYTDGMAGKRVKGITAVPVEEGTIVDATPTTTSFTTSLTGYGDDHFTDQLLLVEMSANKWQARTITDYVSATGQFIVEEAFTSAPANGSAIAVRAEHIHPVAGIAAAALTLQMTESYRATNAAPTLAQAICEILAHLGEMGIVGTTKTLKKFDGTTSSGKTFTLNDATNPTSITETT